VKRSRTKAEQRAFHLKAWQASGLSQRAYCEQAGLALSTLSYWHRHRPTVAAPEFLPVSVRAAEPEPQFESSVVIELANRRKLRLSGRTDPSWLAELVRLLESLPCG
jgi:hypothetical protein